MIDKDMTHWQQRMMLNPTQVHVRTRVRYTNWPTRDNVYNTKDDRSASAYAMNHKQAI